jgi:UTP--glucose-1-phosphate uridylyltransferase
VSSTMVRKAVIPAAGLGTRVRAIAGELPKELLLVAAKPLIVHAIEGLAACGIRQIAVVISPAKDSIRRFLLGESPQFLAPYLDAHLRVLLRSCDFSFFVQKNPAGVADAVSLCREFVGDEPFVLVMPDNVLLDGLPPVAQLLPFFSQYPQDLIGTIRLPADEAFRFGNVGFLEARALSEESPRLLKVSRYSDKERGTVQVPSDVSVLKSFGIGICLPHFFDFIERWRPHAQGEVDDVPVIQAIIREKRLLAVLLEGNGFDVGNPEGYWAANLYVENKKPLHP